VHELIRAPVALCVYVVVASITPGPNNLMLINVGVVRGHRAAAATALGVATGFSFQVAVFGLGVASVVRAVPGLSVVLESAGLAYLSWLAWKLWRSTKLGEAAPMHRFWGAVRYQWVNPKALSMSLTTAGVFVTSTGARAWASALAVGVVAGVCCLPCTLTWGLGGATLAPRLKEERAVVRFNRVAAVALVAMVAWLVATLLAG